MKKHSLLVWRQYIYLLASNPRTIVMLWSTESHITFCLLYNLIHLTSIGDAAALLWSNGYCHMISGGGDGWWEWGNIQCTVGAYSWPGDEWIDPLCWKGRIAQPPHSAHKWAPFVFLTKLFFFMKCKVQTPFLMWWNKRVCFVLTSHERNMARSKRLFTTSCTMKCCESGSAMLKDIIHKQMKMFWENFSLQL